MIANGAEQGHVVAMLVQLMGAVGRLSARLDGVETGIAQLKAELGQLRTEIGPDKSELRREFTLVRATVNQYHASVAGHGMLISEVTDSVRRIADHVNLPPAA